MYVTKTQFQFWLRLYELHGEETFQNSYINYSVPLKLNILNYMVHSGGIEALESKTKGHPSMKKETTKTTTSRRFTRSTSGRNPTSTYGKLVFKKIELLSSSQGNITKEDKVKDIYELRQ
ncbi:hypothetical protein KSI01_20450 [Kurthia sibirica]|uniref:Uncharacterized protein n=1 Tax=Kurthia sibirica TaxID=202750 RepID=A0A2U3AJN0_9BACL|nr:hypothetical protein DEX24_11945 [Kurthia sibirica]GEK34512.1 hypothetical protein KSI01_20450 [Kurthia sibirica]